MQKNKRYTLLNYLNKSFEIEHNINPARIYEVNSLPVKNGYVIYLCTRELREKDNFALEFGIQNSKKYNLPFQVIFIKPEYEHKPKQNFILRQINYFESGLKEQSIIYLKAEKDKLKIIIQDLEPAILIIDFNPIEKYEWLNDINCKIYEIDGHNIIPARYISNKQEYNAATFRRKIYFNICSFLTEYENKLPNKTEADLVLENFINNKLQHYSELKNNPEKDVISGLSKYLNLGFISAQRIAIEVIKSNTDIINKEAFLEELIVRKELADNFCLYCKNFKTFDCIPLWAKNSLDEHKTDLRTYVYTTEELEQGVTHDILWNATQKQLIKEGAIHGYLRMYWAKKISEWSESPEVALKNAIYLNDKYSYDSPSPNGYTGILWAIGGLHDRAFQDWFVSGKIRRMTYNSIKRKFNITNYINKFGIIPS